MKRKVLAVFVFVFIISSVNVSGTSTPEDEKLEIITPVSIMEREPYCENQKLTVVFSIKTEEKSIYIDSITQQLSTKKMNIQILNGLDLL